MSHVKDIEGRHGMRSPPREDPNSENPTWKKGKNTEGICEARISCHTLNAITRGFMGAEETSLARKRYARSVIHIEEKSLLQGKEDSVLINFSRKD